MADEKNDDALKLKEKIEGACPNCGKRLVVTKYSKQTKKAEPAQYDITTRIEIDHQAELDFES